MTISARLLALSGLALAAAGLTQSPVTNIDPANTGTITGRAVFDGVPLPRAVLNMSRNRVCVQRAGPAVESDAVLVDAGGGVQNAFVYIKFGLDPAYTFAVPAEPVVLDQRECRYSPRILGVRAGQPLEILNSDPTLHNTHARPVANPEFNIGQPIMGMRATRTFTAPEVMVPLSSDIHPWMVAFVGVMSHPFFAITSSDGSFTIRGVPPGEYTVEAWHERFGSSTRSATVEPGRSDATTFTFGNR